MKDTGHCACLRENENFKLSLGEILYVTHSFACANEVKIVHSRDVQCNTEESP